MADIKTSSSCVGIDYINKLFFVNLGNSNVPHYRCLYIIAEFKKCVSKMMYSLHLHRLLRWSPDTYPSERLCESDKGSLYLVPFTPGAITRM